MTSKYQDIFFDLDHTLWDFESNSRKTLSEIYSLFNLKQIGIDSSSEFIAEYEKINHSMWGLYRVNKITKSQLRNTRFNKVLNHWKCTNNQLADKINEYYLVEGPKKTGLFAGTISTLTSLSLNYKLHIISNGFEEVQAVKMKNTKLDQFFETITLSEHVGVQKPNPRVFQAALDVANANKESSIYIGDHLEADVLGSMNFGMDQVYFNPNKIQHTVSPTFEIETIPELLHIF